MRRIIGDAARAVAFYLALVLGGAAVGALVGQLVWGQWFLGALAAGCLVAWFVLPMGITEAHGRHKPPLYRPPRRAGANEKKTNALLAYPRPSFSCVHASWPRPARLSLRWWTPCETIGRWRAKTPNSLHLNFLELRACKVRTQSR